MELERNIKWKTKVYLNPSQDQIQKIGHNQFCGFMDLWFYKVKMYLHGEIW